MKKIEEVSGLRTITGDWRHKGLRIGFVPTMGALHQGHLSLIERAKSSCDRLVVSIFVNPLQFGPGEDLEHYPRDLEGDSALLADHGVDALFFPTPELMYGRGHQTRVHVHDLTKHLCGAVRAGHFEGVTTVVCMLFNLVKPHAAFFGRKDYQQFRVIERMVRDLHLDIEIIGCPIFREKDGLAMSSRNAYLSKSERARALSLNRSLKSVEEEARKGVCSAAELLDSARAVLEPDVDRLDYLEIVDSATLERIKKIDQKSVCLVAAFVGPTRLIDNVELHP
jgi:pantoate--beta-alanine ligase